MNKPKPEYVAADYGARDKTLFHTHANGCIVRIAQTVGIRQDMSQQLNDISQKLIALISTNHTKLK